jgi:hypothetical protein
MSAKRFPAVLMENYPPHPKFLDLAGEKVNIDVERVKRLSFECGPLKKEWPASEQEA